MKPQPTGVVPFIDPSAFATQGGGKIQPQNWTRFSTTAEAQDMLAQYNAAIAAIPGASASLAIVEQSAVDGFVLNTPYDPTNPNSVGDLVIGGSITINFQPIIQGEPTPQPISGTISDYVGDIFSRYWKPNMEEYDRNYTQSGGANNVNTPAPGKLQLIWLAGGGLFAGYWVLA